MPNSNPKTIISARDVSIGSSKVPRLEERQTQEIVIGLVGAVGSGCTTTAEKISEILKNEFFYEGETIKLSKIIESPEFENVLPASSVPSERTRRLQMIGTNLRENYGSCFIVDKAVEKIFASREDKEKPGKRRYFTILDSIKHPEEVRRLQRIYGDAFWLIGVFAPEAVRRSRLKNHIGLKPREIADVIDIDEDEKSSKQGQKVQDTIHLSDYFIRNDDENSDCLESSVRRFLELLFRTKLHTPTHDEVGMFAAMSAAMGSACLSRQVGASIVDKFGNVIAEGRNDVPKFGGGLYSAENEKGDKRCYIKTGKLCHNDKNKTTAIDEIMREVGILIVAPATQKQIRTILESSRIKSLIEFSRAVHAEMDAIISVARSGSGQLVGSSLYSTAFPCHSCARHIVAAGLKRVVYIEPYPKSLAIELHGDAISVSESDLEKKVAFLQFEGVAPKRMLHLFNGEKGRKLNGRYITVKPSDANPWVMMPMDGFLTNEQIVVNALGKLEEGPGNDR